ncbi:MAG: acetyl-coenzyme A synthetase N-terminal domain-containing protein, partial [Acidiferrobacter sp.]
MTDESHDAIESLFTESRLFPPPKDFGRGSAMSETLYRELLAEAQADYEGFWARLARAEIDWITPFTRTLDESDAPQYRWFDDGTLNVSANCLDRHIAQRGDKPAIIFEGEPGDVRVLT